MNQAEYRPSLPARLKLVLLGSSLMGLVSFVTLQLNQDTLTAFQFSISLLILGVLCFRWWTSPVHPGIFNYFSPYTAILVNFFIYFGPGNLPPLAAPEQVLITYGSQEYYPPMLIMAMVGLVVFDISYRFMVRLFKINDTLESCGAAFKLPRQQILIPPMAITWYLTCMGIILYMSRNYMMSTLHFVGAESSIDTSFAQAGPALLGVAWGVLSLLLFRPGPRWWSWLTVGMLVSLIPIFLAYQQRRLFFFCFLASLAALALSNRETLNVRKIVATGLVALTVFFLMSMAKATVTRADPGVGRFTQEEKNIFSRAGRIITSPSFFSLQPLETLLTNNARERMAGLDWPAAIMDARLNRDVPFLQGYTNLVSMGMTVPRLIWPNKPSIGIGAVIYTHFGLAAIDPLGTPLSSAYADGGIIGIIFFFFLIALLFSVFLKVITLRQDGMIIYIGVIPLLLRFEDTAMRYPIRWIRWILIMSAVHSLIGYIYRIYAIRKHEDSD